LNGGLPVHKLPENKLRTLGTDSNKEEMENCALASAQLVAQVDFLRVDA